MTPNYRKSYNLAATELLLLSSLLNMVRFEDTATIGGGCYNNNDDDDDDDGDAEWKQQIGNPVVGKKRPHYDPHLEASNGFKKRSAVSFER